MTIPARLSLVILGVADVARATAFYASLGWEVSSSSQAEISFIRTADSGLGLFEYAALAEDAKLPVADPAPFRGITLAINLESEAEVDRVLAEAVAKGGQLQKPAERAEWGGYSGYFLDLDGYAWEVAYNPSFSLASDGRLELPE